MSMTKLGMFGMGMMLTYALTGCGGGGDDPGTPVAEMPLAGTMAGQPFVAKSALASSGISSGSATSVTIYEKAVTCANRFGISDRQILLSVDKWTDGTSFQLGGTQDTPLGIPLPLHSVTFVSPGTGSIPNNSIVAKGRVEVVKASTLATAGTLRLRANGGDSGSVEGQIAVTQCE